jgi:UDP-N-acetylmuramate dehydrogenase
MLIEPGNAKFNEAYEPFLDAVRDAIVDPRRPQLSEEILRDEPLHRYTVARLGGPADILINITKNDKHLIDVVRLALQYGIPYRIIGGGANVLFSDEGVRGLIIVNHVRTASISRESGLVDASAGYNLIHLTRETIDAGLAGLEWAVNVPGTLGGAIVNNAGAHGSDIAYNLKSIALFTDHVETWPVERLHYSYRESALKRAPFRFVVLRGLFQLVTGGDPEALRARAESFMAQRRRTQPPGASLGSMFKNPPGQHAGRLIEEAGLKGTRIGGVIVSPLHANFFVNVENGTAADYLALIDHVREKVQQQFGITLELEIELIPAAIPL